MKTLFKTLSLLLFTLCFSCIQEKAPEKDTYTPFFIGTYSRDNSRGIYSARITDQGIIEGLKAVADVSNPSFLKKTANGRFLLAVSEEQSGELLSFNIKGDTLIPVGNAPSFGAHPCHISTRDNDLAVVSNYSGGSIALYKVGNKGHLTVLDSVQFSGKGAHWRQDAPHAHSSFFIGDEKVATVDLGTDKIHINRIAASENQKELLAELPIALDSGAGPRHLAVHPSSGHAYVINELHSSITHLIPNTEGNTWSAAESITTIPENYEGENLCADIHIDPQGEFLYASNRGHQSIAIFRIDQKSGSLIPIGIQEVFGAWPRNFAITPNGRYLLVANEQSGNIVSFKRNTQNGTLLKTDEIKVPAPVCIAF